MRGHLGEPLTVNTTGAALPAVSKPLLQLAQVEVATPTFIDDIWQWHHEHYERLRKAEPGRAKQAADDIRNHIIPFLTAAGVDQTGDVTRDMVLDFVDTLAGRHLDRYREDAFGDPDILVPVDEAAIRCGRAPRTVLGWIACGRIRGHDNAAGQRCVRLGDLVTQRRLAEMGGHGLAKTTADNIVSILKRFLHWSEAIGRTVNATALTYEITAVKPAPSVASGRTKPERSKIISFEDARRIATRMHVVHQLTLWMLRVLGLRVTEAFGVRVGDIIVAADLEDMHVLLLRRKGGKYFLSRDDNDNIVRTTRQDWLKTPQSVRALVIPRKLMELLEIIIAAFHTRPDGSVDREARLIPSLRGIDVGVSAFSIALQKAATEVGLGHIDTEGGLCAHAMRTALATQIAWNERLTNLTRRRWVGHIASSDVFGRIYTKDDPGQAIRHFRAVAEDIDTAIAQDIDTLIVTPGRAFLLGHGNPKRAAMADIEAALAASGWTDNPDDGIGTDDIAVLLDCTPKNVRDWLYMGLFPGERTEQGWRVRLDDVLAFRDRHVARRTIHDIAADLERTYHQVYRWLDHLGLHLDTDYDRTLVVTPAAEAALRAEHHRLQNLATRSVGLTEAAKQMGVSVSTARLLVQRGKLKADPETDLSAKLYVTRVSVAAMGTVKRRRRASPARIAKPS